MKIILVGGGSGGSVSPLLAVAEEIKNNHKNAEFLFIGANSGPERSMAESADLEFVAIPAEKWRRYFSLKNLAAPFVFTAAFFRALIVLKAFRPDAVFGSGSFVQVPVIWAAFTLKIPCLIHQQDLYPSLANKLCQMFAEKITVTFADSLTDFSAGTGLFYKKSQEKIVLTGNPFRHSLAGVSRAQALRAFGLKNDFPTALIMGGGTGSAFINALVKDCLPKLTKTAQVVHITGGEKASRELSNDNYRQFGFISDMAGAYACADIVVCRAGLSTITELSNLAKISIIIPLPETHQELNARFLSEHHAAVSLPQKDITPENFVSLIRKLLVSRKTLDELKANISEVMPKDSAKKIAEMLLKLANHE